MVRVVAVSGARLRGAVGAVGVGARAGCPWGWAAAAAAGGRGDGDRAALLAKAGGAGHRLAAVLVGVPASTVRGWLRRITAVADRVLAVLAAAAAELGVDFLPPAQAAGPVGAVEELVGALARGAVLRLGGSWVPWRLAAVLTGGRLLAPGGPELVAGQVMSGNTNSLWAAGPSPGGVC